MRLEQFLKARDIVNEDATIVGNYFGDYEGDSCAVGGLYIHPLKIGISITR